MHVLVRFVEASHANPEPDANMYDTVTWQIQTIVSNDKTLLEIILSLLRPIIWHEKSKIFGKNLK